jgi:hypothetical protein
MQRSAVVALSKGESMSEVHVLAIDLDKRNFQICGTGRGGSSGKLSPVPAD